MPDEKDIIEALKVIQEVCKTMTTCNECPLRGERLCAGETACAVNDEIPADWGIVKEEEVRRLIY